MSVETILEDIALMEASGTDVFFRFATESGKHGKTDIMTPASARSFLDVAEFTGVVFTRIWMGRAEQF